VAVKPLRRASSKPGGSSPGERSGGVQSKTSWQRLRNEFVRNPEREEEDLFLIKIGTHDEVY
jgi:hypothetical protein